MRRVVITGLGAVSPIGHGKDTFWKALKEGRNGVAPIEQFDVTGYPVTFGAEIKDFDPTIWLDKKEVRRSDKVIHFALAAASLAVEDASLPVETLDPHRFGVYIGSGQGGIETSFNNFHILMEKGPSRVSPFFIPMMISNMSAAYVAIKYRAKGPCLCIVTACATSTDTIGQAFHTILRDDADIILAGGSEAALRSIGIAGFAAMKALSTRNDEPHRASRPFDRDRDGFIMGDGSGILVLEELEHALKRGAHIYAELVGYGSTCDASHITAPDPVGEGAVRAMKQAMARAKWRREDVDLINAHGTSTPLNDKMESTAIRTVFGAHTDSLMINSTKSMIGHCLGAAGALETIAAIQSFEEGFVHPTINYENPDPECNIPVVGKEGIYADVSRILVNNFGFGGHNGVLAIQRFEQ
ncbi:MAG: beta-ketoacyl-ACP synthase II [Synergistales bacterium]|nr:beta-ketoacyl-ACP synthase II [Synergistales bacterium]